MCWQRLPAIRECGRGRNKAIRPGEGRLSQTPPGQVNQKFIPRRKRGDRQPFLYRRETTPSESEPHVRESDKKRENSMSKRRGAWGGKGGRGWQETRRECGEGRRGGSDKSTPCHAGWSCLHCQQERVGRNAWQHAHRQEHITKSQQEHEVPGEHEKGDVRRQQEQTELSVLLSRTPRTSPSRTPTASPPSWTPRSWPAAWRNTRQFEPISLCVFQISPAVGERRVRGEWEASDA